MFLSHSSHSMCKCIVYDGMEEEKENSLTIGYLDYLGWHVGLPAVDRQIRAKTSSVFLPSILKRTGRLNSIYR